MSDAASQEPIFLIDLDRAEAEPMAEITLASVGLTERAHLQRWITEHPEIVGHDLLLVTTEFDQWEIRDQRVADRLDVLFLAADGSLVVAELKRDHALDTTELQALKYAAYCAQLTVAEVVEAHAQEHGCTAEESERLILDHAPSLVEEEIGSVRVRLVAGSFGPAVTSVVLWLRDHDIDIGCIEVKAHRHASGTAVLSVRQILPLPEAEDYYVRRRRRDQGEGIAREARQRAARSVDLLGEAGVLAPGDVVSFRIEAVASADRPAVQAVIDDDPLIGRAVWTGLGSRSALRWEHNGEPYSTTGLAIEILARAGVSKTAIPGPDYWTIPSTGRSFYEESKYLAGPA